MPAELLTIQACNDGRISVFFDACIIIDAIKDKNRGATIELLRTIDPALRLVASMTLYEVAFADRSKAPSTLEQNQKWVRDRMVLIPFHEKVGERFERFLSRESSLTRGKTGLADLLLACWALSQRTGQVKPAIATRNKQDFEHLPVRLVKEFLPGA